ncbi:MAG: sialidase family protein, partial [Thermoguttaceae bacterium]|nr:sialidase family protein [Thermoguttaceae bacterium]
LFRSDNGQTWSDAVPSCLDAPLSPAQIKRIPGSDNLLAVWNPLKPSKNRSGLDIAVLTPDASKILTRKYIEKTDKSSFQYPHILFDSHNNVLVGYFTFGGNYRIVRFNMKQL